MWGRERDVSARRQWCSHGHKYCPNALVTFLQKKHLCGKTMCVQDTVTLTVLGTTVDRKYATNRLVPVLRSTMRVLAVTGASVSQVHVTYCNACGPRELPAHAGSIITSESVNGGMSMGSSMGVLIFREEDAQKVLVHELIHLYGVDTYLRRLPSHVEAHVARARKGFWGSVISSGVALNEAYTEAIASILHHDDIARARHQAVSVAKKILAHFGWGAQPFRESTHVFSYYIVKAAMLVNSKALVEIMKNGKASQHEMVKFMDASLRSRRFRNAIETSPIPDDSNIPMTDGVLI